MLKVITFSFKFVRRELAKEVVELLMGAADGAKSLIDASDRLILYVEIARLFGTLGYQRKAAFFSRQVAQLYLQQDNACAAISAMQVLTMTSNAYHVQSRRASSKLHTSHHVGISSIILYSYFSLCTCSLAYFCLVYLVYVNKWNHQ